MRRSVSLAILGLVTAGLAGSWLGSDRVREGGEPAWHAALFRIGLQSGALERDHNFGAVVPGRLYRSALPDEHFIRYVHDRYGIERVISLNGARPFHSTARELGIEVDVLHWRPSHAPPDWQLRRVLDAMEENVPTLVHCTEGRDRTGYAVASYRVLRQGWEVQPAVDELRSYGHDTDEFPWLAERIASLR